MAEGRFQSDLLYELAVFTIHIPPLRQHRDDIPLLVDHIIKYFAGIRQTLGDEVAASSPKRPCSWPATIGPAMSTSCSAFSSRHMIEGKGAVVATESLARAVGQQSRHCRSRRRGRFPRMVRIPRKRDG